MTRLIIKATGKVKHIPAGNEHVYHLKTKAADRIIQFLWVTAAIEDITNYLSTKFNDWAFYGVKLHQCWENFSINSDFFNKVASWVEKHDAAEKTESYIFSPRLDSNHVQVNSLKRPKNYMLASKKLLDSGEFRDSLMSARRALENLCEKAWHHDGKFSDKSDGLISVARRGPNQPWDLRMLAENLKSKINRSSADIPGKEQIVAAFTKLLGTSGGSPCWTCLNKGTHEESDLPEFDQQTVTEIVEGLELLDNALNS